ncbi:hypothetical protein [Nocardia sp. NPDC020380]|uniref:hypothetical protein n=1 Tax=Nocardia sp. NPDC020380 TaxID=3364309 RepID=UPI00379C96BD
MLSANNHNDLLLSMMVTLIGSENQAGDGPDLEPSKAAFECTTGDFRAKFTAAVQARIAQLAVPEVYVDLPERPQDLRKPELDALVRPAADGFLRSHPNRDELLDQVDRIRRRQEKRPDWIPRVDRNGRPLPDGGSDSSATRPCPGRLLVITALDELGDIPVLLPTEHDERPELKMSPDGAGAWEAALYAALGIAADNGYTTVSIDARANEALVPESVRWWPSDPERPVAASEDPGAASELLATSPTLGGFPVSDNTWESCEAVTVAVGAAADWRYSARWSLETWDPGDGLGTLATARASIGAWVENGRSGLIVFVFGGALHETEGLFGVPATLHSYLLSVSRSADGTDAVDAVHRVILSCPGEFWCHRGGCPEVASLSSIAALAPVITAGEVGSLAAGVGWASEGYDRLYGTGCANEFAEDVLGITEEVLSSSGWVKLTRWEWEGGLVDALLRRGEHCLTASYDPVTRQVRLLDGRDELEAMLEVLADDGILVDSDGENPIDTSETALEHWGAELLSAAKDLLSGQISVLPESTLPIQATVLGLHPMADGTLRGPGSVTLAEKQLTVLLRTAGVLNSGE